VFTALPFSSALRFPYRRIPSLRRFAKEAAQAITPALGGRIILQS
jgi:hypothetical protein